MRSLLLLLLGVTTAAAQSVVVPNTFETTRGTGGANTLLRNAANPRTYMFGIDQSWLTGIPVGANLCGVSFRAQVSTGNPAIFPPSDTTWTSYDVALGACVPLASWSTTVANNFASTPVTVRSGPMLLETGVFVNNTGLPSPQPNPWGDFFWDFQTTFPYAGGNLALLMTHTGSSQPTVALFTDYQTALGTTIKALTASSYQAVSGTNIGSPAILRLHYARGTGCPGTGGLVPNLVLTGDTVGGGNATFAFANAPASTVGILALGAQQISAPLPGGCTLYTVPLILLTTVLNANGRAAITLNIPPGVVGSLEAQGFVVDAGAAAGFTATHAVTLTAR